jgi:hypothetical protein
MSRRHIFNKDTIRYHSPNIAWELNAVSCSISLCCWLEQCKQRDPHACIIRPARRAQARSLLVASYSRTQEKKKRSGTGLVQDFPHLKACVESIVLQEEPQYYILHNSFVTHPRSHMNNGRKLRHSRQRVWNPPPHPPTHTHKSFAMHACVFPCKLL